MSPNLNTSKSALLGLLLFLTGTASVSAHSQELDITQEQAAGYSTYQVHIGLPRPAGSGVRFVINRDWFVFGETYRSNQTARIQKSRLFINDKTRTIIVGGGIYF
ncbi:MAG: hypothetical protein PVG20_00115 [Thioalkalispiraceae bacterium]|jgi:hypothetical protein